MGLRTGKTLLIVNPAAKRGHGAEAAQHALRFFRSHLGAFAMDVANTLAPGQGTELARQSADYANVVALGGDGLIHEVINGLMQLPKTDRPALGVLPVGSGNDYARSLGIPFNIGKAVELLLDAPERSLDIGSCNGEYFDETLSFGLDAGIGLGTSSLRTKVHMSGAPLYFVSGLNQLLRHFDTYRFRALLDGTRELEGVMTLFAVQLGPTYGGGWRICPDAQLDDGFFDLCWADSASLPFATYVFIRAKNAGHLGYDVIHTERAQSLHLEFDRRPPVQLDGEPHLANSYDIAMHHQALRVLVPTADA